MTRRVRLIDGTQVASDSEAYRHECEARAIARLPTPEERHEWLRAVGIKRGLGEAARLRETVNRWLHAMHEENHREGSP